MWDGRFSDIFVLIRILILYRSKFANRRFTKKKTFKKTTKYITNDVCVYYNSELRNTHYNSLYPNFHTFTSTQQSYSHQTSLVIISHVFFFFFFFFALAAAFFLLSKNASCNDFDSCIFFVCFLDRPILPFNG